MIDQTELDRLAERLAKIGPGWTPFVLDDLYRAERNGTMLHSQVARDASGLLKAVEDVEARLAPPVPVQVGLASTVSHTPRRTT